MNHSQPDAYGRVTNPDRYSAVVDTARGLVARLAGEYEVVESRRSPAVAFSDAVQSSDRTIRLAPAEGAPIEFLVTDFPGVALRFGEWGQAVFPVCGCDACDEEPADLSRRLTEMVQGVVDGGYEEKMTKRWLTWSFIGNDKARVGRRRLERGEWKRLGGPGARRWPPWPERRHAP